MTVPDHARTFTDEFLDKFRSRNSDESTVSVMSHSSRQKRFTSSRRTVKKNTLEFATSDDLLKSYLWLSDTERFKQLGMLNWKLDDFFDFFNLLVQTSNHFVGWIWHFFDHHQGDERIDLNCHIKSAKSSNWPENLVKQYHSPCWEGFCGASRSRSWGQHGW